jgi:hypothetical protein
MPAMAPDCSPSGPAPRRARVAAADSPPPATMLARRRSVPQPQAHSRRLSAVLARWWGRWDARCSPASAVLCSCAARRHRRRRCAAAVCRPVHASSPPAATAAKATVLAAAHPRPPVPHATSPGRRIQTGRRQMEIRFPGSPDPAIRQAQERLVQGWGERRRAAPSPRPKFTASLTHAGRAPARSRRPRPAATQTSMPLARRAARPALAIAIASSPPRPRHYPAPSRAPTIAPLPYPSPSLPPSCSLHQRAVLRPDPEPPRTPALPGTPAGGARGVLQGGRALRRGRRAGAAGGDAGGPLHARAAAARRRGVHGAGAGPGA